MRAWSFWCLVCIALSGWACATTAAPPQEAALGEPPKKGEPFYELPPIPAGAPVLEGAESGLQRPERPPTPTGEVDLALAPYAIKRADLNAALKHGPSWPLRLAQLRPAFDGGRFLGYEILSFGPDCTEKMRERLREGDILVGVNKQSIARPEDYMSIWTELPNQPSLVLTMLRDGQSVDLEWPIVE